MPDDIEQLLTLATDPAAPARKRVRAACAVLDALHPKPIRRAPRQPVARTPAELHAALAALQARREHLAGSQP